MARHFSGRAAGAALLAGALAACGGDDDRVAQDDTTRACAAIAEEALPDARVTAATAVGAGPFQAPGARAPVELPAFCRIEAVATPSADSHINFEVWVPMENWNQRLLVVGNGGYTGAIGYAAMAQPLREGWAVAGGDTGHVGDDMRFVVGHPEKMADWGHRSVHAVVTATRPLVQAFFDQPPRYAYFSGCSTGGHQGYAQAQRYPDDFDGILAGAPGNNRVRLNAGFLWQFVSNRAPGDDANPIIPASKLPMVQRAAIATCDALDGVEDGVIDDPRQCHFQPAQLLCTGEDGPDCLTAPQVTALERMYDGARNPRTGERIYPGWEPGSEAGWSTYWANPARPTEPQRADFWRYWAFDDPEWDWWSFDWDQDLAMADERVGAVVDAVETDLSGLRARGAKLLAYTGWADPVVAPADTIDYYEEVTARVGSLPATQEFFRLFMVPGMGHCSGGAGTDQFDALGALVEWVEAGAAPDVLVAARRAADGTVQRTRPLCAYPQVARYTGAGSTDEAASFHCVTP